MNDLRLVSQSFLGKDSDAILGAATVGVVGAGGGGSHVVQQLAHVGIGNLVVVDHDTIELKNLNRVVGAMVADVVTKTPKVSIAQRIIESVNTSARVTPLTMRWQQSLDHLRRCGIIFGCVDSFREREELERFARRHLIPYIDLGMDVHQMQGGYFVGGQAVLSSPGGPCLRCLGIVTDERLTMEAKQYGDAGGRPQVVWTNGVLASLGVGLCVQLLSPWSADMPLAMCCEFDANRHRVETSRLDNADGLKCVHYRPDELGDAYFSRAGGGGQ